MGKSLTKTKKLRSGLKMGLLKKVGKAMGRAVVKTGKLTAAAIKKKRLQNQVKRQMLERFTIKDLKKMIKEYRVPEPEIPERGYLRKDDYVKHAMAHFKLKEVIDYAKRHKIKISDIMDYYIREMERIEKEAQLSPATPEERRLEEEKYGVEYIEYQQQPPKKPQYSPQQQTSIWPPPPPPPQSLPPPPPEFMMSSTKYDDIIEALQNDLANYISSMRFADEEDFRSAVFLFLQGRFGNKYALSYPPTNASMGDILIDNGSLVMELKYADNTTTLDRGIREIKQYKRFAEKVVMLILDVGKLNPTKITEYKSYYEEEGAIVIVVQGQSRKKPRKKYIHIEYGSG